MGFKRSADYKAPAGKLVRVRLGEQDGKIQSIQISGDFFLVPEESLSKLEKTLIGTPLSEPELKILVNRFFNATRPQGLGVSPEDFVQALLSAKTES